MDLLTRVALGSVLVVGASLIVSACRDSPGIDGASIPPVGSEADPPACEPVCDRLAGLCGYAPADCVTACADYDDPHRVCVGRAASCQEALETCQNDETVEDDTDAEPDAEPDPADADDDAAVSDGGADG